MNKYVTEFKLDYDPFAPGTQAKVFFEGGERRLLVEEAIQLLHEGSMLVAVTGPLGSGKSTIAREVRRCMGADAVCISIPATLFMNQAQFLDAVGNQLPKNKHIAAAPNIETGIARLKQFSAELDLEAQSLILLVDDAHELSAEVLELIESLVRRSGKSFVRVMLFGERQLNNLLQNSLTDEFQANLAHFELTSFTPEDTLEYLQIKMGAAGLKTPLPFSGRIIGEIQNSSNGMPAAINARAADFLLSGAVAESDSVDADSDTDYVPEGKQYNFDAQDHMQFDLDMVDVGTQEFSQREISDNREQDGVLPAWMEFAAGYRYQLAASALAVVLLLTLFVWNSGVNPESSTLPIDTATISATETVNRIQLSPPVAAVPEAESPMPASDVLAAISANTDSNSPDRAAAAVSLQADSAAVTNKTVASSIVPPNAADSESSPVTAAVPAPTVPVPKPPAPTVSTPQAPVSAAPASPAVARLSGYEQQLLKYAANSYAIQILGSHSEANVQKFIADKTISEPYGYYESRHQNKPWFVVVAGNYRDRAAATAVIDKLPAALRDMQPWIRSVGEIQRDIRLQNNL